MFLVKCLNQNVDKKRLITSGITFGYFDKSLFFEVEAENIDNKLLVNLIVYRNKGKNGLEIKSIKENELKLYYFVNNSVGTSGMKNPIGFDVLNEYFLGFMFWVESLPESKSFKLSYEFYEGELGRENRESDV